MDTAIIGGGVIGFACAAALARRGRSVVILEQHRQPGQEATSRNSEVIHAGLYYPPGSLKASTSVEGRARLYERCRALRIPHRQTGKLVVAVEESELELLESLRAQGTANGVSGLEILEAREVARREPRVRAAAALWSPDTGIVDSHQLCSSYQAEAERHGAQLALATRVVSLERTGSGWRLETLGPDLGRFQLEAASVVNAAGISAGGIARAAGLDLEAIGYRVHLCKGDYFSLSPALGPITRHLVYPLPTPAGLGIHVTFDLGGCYRLGPDAEYVEEPSLEVDPARATHFAEVARRYLPELRASQLSPAFAGIRPKLQGRGEPFRDFVIEEASVHGAPGLVNLLGIESPGLTASAAIAERVAALLA